MIKTTDILTEYKKHTKDNSTDNVTTGKLRMQHYYEFILGEIGNYIVERTKYGILKDGQRSYLLFPDYIQIKTVRVKFANVWYPLEEIVSTEAWHLRTAIATETNIPEAFHIFNEQGNMHIEVDGIPSADGDINNPNLEIVYEGYQDPLLFPNDVTGTGTFENGSAAVVATTGTPFTAAMVGRFIQPNGGKYWYELKTYTDTTNMALVNYFQEADATAVSFTIAEMMRIPQQFHYTPLWGAVADYYAPKDQEKYKLYNGMYARELLMLQNKYQSKSKGAVQQGIQVNAHRIGWVPRNYPKSNIG